MLKLRILTAIILIPLVIWAVIALQQPYFALVSALVIALAAWEWAQFCSWKKIWIRALYAVAVVCSLFIAVHLPGWAILFAGAFWWLIVMCWILFLRKKEKFHPISSWLVAVMGFLVLVPCWEALQVLQHKPILFLYLLIIIWLADTSAYFGGRLLGRNKLAPSISPNKTMEGFLTALAVTFTFALLAGWFVFTPHDVDWNWILPVMTATAASVVGDLFESLLKRQRGLKDSGHLLPGHGGVLDRIDSLTAAAPVFVCGILGLNLL